MNLEDKIKSFADSLRREGADLAIEKKEPLEIQKSGLDLIKESLPSMQEYAQDVSTEADKTTQTLDELFKKYEQVLNKKGIKDIDDFVKEKEYEEMEEVVAYKNALEAIGVLKETDGALKKRLQDLGVAVPQKDFSYDLAKEVLLSKLGSLDLQIKLQTSSGRLEVVNNLSEEMGDSIPLITFFEQKENHIQKFVLKDNKSGHTGNIIIKGKEVIFENFDSLPLVPENLFDLETKYGKDVTREALLKAYQNKIKVSFEKHFGEDYENAKTDIENSSSDKLVEARAQFMEFKTAVDDFFRVLDEKSSEFEKQEMKNIGTSNNPFHESYNYKDDLLPLFSPGEKVSNSIRKLMEENTVPYPPILNIVFLTKYIKKRIEQIKEFTEAIKSLKTTTDVDDFFRSSRGPAKLDESTIGKFHINFLTLQAETLKNEDLYPKYDYGIRGGYQVPKELKFAEYDKALVYFDQEDGRRDKLTQQMIDAVKAGIDANQKHRELVKAISEQGLGNNLLDFEDRLEKIKSSKKEAKSLLEELPKLKDRLPNNPKINLKIERSNLMVANLSYAEEIERLEKEKTDTVKLYNELDKQVYDHISNQPKFFGRNQWQKELSVLQQRLEGIAQAKSAIVNRISFLSDQWYFTTKIGDNLGQSQSLSKEQDTGQRDVVFGKLQKALEEIINQPISILSQDADNLYQEYQNLRKSLGSKN